jgi:hypothetical protein
MSLSKSALPGPKPISRQVSQSWTTATAAVRSAASGSVSRSHRSAARVEEDGSVLLAAHRHRGDVLESARALDGEE